MRRGDTSDIPEVQKAAQELRKRMDIILKEAQELGLFPEDISVKGAESYFARSYNLTKITKNINVFRKQLSEEIKKNLSEDKLDYLDDIIDDIINNIRGGRDNRYGSTITSSSSPLKARKLDLSDEFLEEWLDSSATNMISNYQRSMVPRIEFKKKFGVDEFKDLKKEIRREYDELSRKINDPKQQLKLENQYNKDLDDLERLYERVMGINPKHPRITSGNLTNRTSRVVREVGRQAKLGGVLISSLPDIARPIIISGIRPFLKTMFDLIRDPAFAKMALKEKRKYTAALEVMEQTRLMQMADVADESLGNTFLERAIDYTGKQFNKATGLPYWNSFLKQLSGILQESEILKVAKQLASGKKVSKKRLQRLAKLGLDEHDIKMIGEQYSKHGKQVGDVHYANFDSWDEGAFSIMTKMKSALGKNADETIISIDAGTLPKFMDGELAPLMKMIMQFKSFLIGAHNKLLVAGLQQSDINFYISLLGGVYVGTNVVYLKDLFAGRDKPRTTTELLVEGIDRSGTLTMLMEGNAMLDKMSDGKYSVNSALGIRSPNRYKNRNKAGALVGPAVNDIFNLIDVFGNTIQGEFSQRDMHKLRMMAPFQNLFYLRNTLTEGEKKLNQAFGTDK